MSAGQAKLAHQFLLVINIFLPPVDEYEERAHARHLIGRAVSKAVRRWLTGRN